MAGPSSRSLPWRRQKPPAEAATAAAETDEQASPPPPGEVLVATAEPETDSDTETATTGGASVRRTWRDVAPLTLFRAAHPAQVLVTAVALTAVAALTGRDGRELGLVLVTVLVGQSLLGWVNDLADRGRDARHRRTGKPVSDGRLEVGTVVFAIVCGLLLVVPLSIANGATAGSSYLISLAVAAVGTFWPRRNLLSWLPWAVSFALLPAFLSYGGWGGHHRGDPPAILVTLLAALLGVGVHVLVSLWGLVADHEDGWNTLPLRLGRRVGTQRLLVLTTAYLVVVTLLLALVGAVSGLSR